MDAAQYDQHATEVVYQDAPDWTVDDVIGERIASCVNERPFYVAEMQDIVRKHQQWLKQMPRVKPFYAVKCNNLPDVVSFLAMLGINFDCASKAEIEQVLALGVSPARVIYANPCKTRSFIKYARSVGVNLMTFDNELELHKVAALHPHAQLVLRIKGDDRKSRCKFNIKFGADLGKCHALLELARELGLTVVGVSFHNGSDCADVGAYARSIATAKQVFMMGGALGHDMRVLDIGGGFPGHTPTGAEIGGGVSFEKLAAVCSAALDAHFPAFDPQSGLPTGYEIIAEPGRYYVASALTLVSMVIAKRVERDDRSARDCFMYYLNDGVYGAFNNIIFEQATPAPQLIELSDSVMCRRQSRYRADAAGADSPLTARKLSVDGERKLHPTVLWGPTCDSVDCIKRDFSFPELHVGEWIAFRNMGAYTCCAATNFNGFEKAAVIVV